MPNNRDNAHVICCWFQDFADEFYKMFNNQPFNSIEPDVCHLVYVAHVETVKEQEVTYITNTV